LPDHREDVLKLRETVALLEAAIEVCLDEPPLTVVEGVEGVGVE
jgi:hypothetical protein